MNDRVLSIAHPRAELYGSDRVTLEVIDAVVGAGGRAHPQRTLRCGARLDQGPRLHVTRMVLVHVHESERQAPRAVRRALAMPLLLAPRIAVNSPFSRWVLADSYRLLGRRAQVLCNGLPGPAAWTAAQPAIDSPVRLLFLGLLAPRKGPQVAIEVVRELRAGGIKSTLTLVGAVSPGYEWFEEQPRTQDGDAGRDDMVTVAGFTPDNWPSLAAADILLVPSQGDEPFGNTAVEGIVAGRPVVVTSGSGLDEAVDGVESVRAQVAHDAEQATQRFSPAAFRQHLLAEMAAVGFLVAV